MNEEKILMLLPMISVKMCRLDLGLLTLKTTLNAIILTSGFIMLIFSIFQVYQYFSQVLTSTRL